MRAVLSLMFGFTLLLNLNLVWSAEPETSSQDIISQAQRDLQKGQYTNVVSSLTKLLKSETRDPAPLFLRATAYSRLGQSARAISDYTLGLGLDPESAMALYQRGSEYLKIGDVPAAISDLDAFAKLQPASEPQLWQRGIAYYYAGQFAKGRKQFEEHQKVNPRDVENSVWHFLCVAAEEGPAAARRKFIETSGDSRVPMKEIHELFAGRSKPESVLAAATNSVSRAGTPAEQSFYAQLYLGLFFTAEGDKTKARAHTTQAVVHAEKLSRADHYMAAIALLHMKHLTTKSK